MCRMLLDQQEDLRNTSVHKIPEISWRGFFLVRWPGSPGCSPDEARAENMDKDTDPEKLLGCRGLSGKIILCPSQDPWSLVGSRRYYFHFPDGFKEGRRRENGCCQSAEKAQSPLLGLMVPAGPGAEYKGNAWHTPNLVPRLECWTLPIPVRPALRLLVLGPGMREMALNILRVQRLLIG